MAENGTPRVRALIVDDEELGRRMLRSLLAGDDDVQVVGEAASAQEARRKINEQQPDLVFMDVEMPGGNGIEVLQDIEAPMPYVILVTAHPEFALPAFEVQVSDYLVKPVQRQRFLGSHRSAIVNAAHVREVRSSGDGRYNIYLHGGQALPMGRARREILEKPLSGIGSKD